MPATCPDLLKAPRQAANFALEIKGHRPPPDTNKPMNNMYHTFQTTLRGFLQTGASLVQLSKVRRDPHAASAVPVRERPELLEESGGL